jgi:Pectic acid lyase
MSNRVRRLAVALALLAGAVSGSVKGQSSDRTQALAAMKRATAFMVDKASNGGGYVWSYLPDFSRRWGELEARDTMIWIQPPGTATMGHLFLDAYHATGDEFYYQAAQKVAGALSRAQHSSGGWNYLADFAGEKSLREWYDTIGRNAWRLEEFQYHWGNATFDDAGTAESAKFLLRLYMEKRDAKFKPALDKAIRFVTESQYEVGGWPQRFPRSASPPQPGMPDYTSYITFNDDVAAENIEFLAMCNQVLGDEKLRDPIARGMNAFVAMQQPRPQPGWALQYTLDLKPAGARTYEPKALVTHTTAANVESLIRFYRLTGDAKFLARVPEALDWLEKIQLPSGIAPAGRTHPTFIEIGTDKPLYVHRRGSNVVNGQYYVDNNPKNTIGHYSAFRHVDLPRLRKLYEEAKALAPAEATNGSPLKKGAGAMPLPRFFTVRVGEDGKTQGEIEQVLTGLKPEGYWLASLGTNSHPYTGPGSSTVTPGDFARSHVGDKTDTSPFPDENVVGISVATYVRNMGVLIRYVDGSRQ